MINVAEFGVVKHTDINQTKLMQSIINQAEIGETIYIPRGYEIIIGSLELKSELTIYLEQNSKLIACSNYHDYERWTTAEEYQGQPMCAMLYAKDGHNITITGRGTIDGNGRQFIESNQKYIYKLDRYPRVTMLFFENINNLIIENITITNGCFWTIHPVGCKNIKFRSLNILQDLKMPNCDGIDPDHCQNVVVSDCIIESADDCIVLKNTKHFKHYGSTTDVVVTNCILKSTSAGFKIGTESYGDFKNICLSNSIIKDSNRGVSVQLRDGGNLKNMVVSNLVITTRKFDNVWWGKGEPIAITSFQRHPGKSALSKISNIKFVNLIIEAENAIYLAGQEPKLIQKISLDQIDFELVANSKWDEHHYDNRPFGDEHIGLFKDELAAIYSKNIKTLTISNFDFESELTTIKLLNK